MNMGRATRFELVPKEPRSSMLPLQHARHQEAHAGFEPTISTSKVDVLTNYTNGLYGQGETT